MNRRFDVILTGAMFISWALASQTGLVSSTQVAPRPTLSPFKEGGIYGIGDKVGWTVSLPTGSSSPSGTYSYVLKKNNVDTIQSGKLDLSSGTATIQAALNEPAMVYLQITPPTQADSDSTSETGRQPSRRRGGVVAGAVVAPLKLRPVVSRPRDFDAFWKSKIKMLQEIPLNPVLTPGESNKPDVDFATIKMDHINGAHVYGQIARPKGKTKLPALLLLQWASPPYPLQKSWVTNYAAQGWLTLNIEPHDVLPDQPPSYYSSLSAELKNYQAIGQDDRDKSYFLQMYLADYRAVDYLTKDPDWDGKSLVVMGTSMGGQQSLCVAGLHPKITHVIVEEPSGCDLNAALHGRQEGYPNFPPDNSRVMETARYFDCINFASHIRATSLVAMGFVDTVAPPAGIWTAFNQIRGPKEVAPMFEAPHNNTATQAQQLPFSTRSSEWLTTLVGGGAVKPRSLKYP